MKTHQYAPFIEWTAATYIKERRHTTKPSQATLAWLRAYGITGGQVDTFLRHSLGNAATMSNALVMDILELSNSKVRKTVEEDYAIDALLHTWSTLAQVYGRASNPSEQQIARLQLMVEASYALIMADGTGFPGSGQLLRLYWQESELLDLTRIDRSEQEFTEIAVNVELNKSHRRALPKPAGAVARRLQPRSKPVRQCNTSEPVSTSTSVTADDEDRLPVLPTSGRRWADPSTSLASGLFGNWRDRWDNTLPSGYRAPWLTS